MSFRILFEVHSFISKGKKELIIKCFVFRYDFLFLQSSLLCYEKCKASAPQAYQTTTKSSFNITILLVRSIAAPTCAKKKEEKNCKEYTGHLGSPFHSVKGIISSTGTAVTLHVHEVRQLIARFQRGSAPNRGIKESGVRLFRHLRFTVTS